MSQRAEETFEFTVGERPALVVNNPAGSVTVTAGEAGRIGVQVTKTLRGVFMGGNGLEAFERVQVSAEQHNETVRITVRSHPLVSAGMSSRWRWRFRFRRSAGLIWRWTRAASRSMAYRARFPGGWTLAA